MASEIERPKNCGECARFIAAKDDPPKGYCAEWTCMVTPDCVCHPNIGLKRKETVQK